MLARTLLITGICVSVLSACGQMPFAQGKAIKHGQSIYLKECSQCHGSAGDGAGVASLGLGVTPPNLTSLSANNDGTFPREFVRRYVLGLVEKTDPDAAMPEFSKVGLSHVYPKGGADGEVLEADFEDLLDYIETLQK